MADSSYRPRVYRARGGDKMVAATGGAFSVDGGSVDVATGTAGGSVTVNKGGTFTVATGAKRVHPLRTATASLTMKAAESGVTVVGQAAGNIYTLPSSTTAGKGIVYRFVAGTGALATSGAVGMKIRPAANDKILGGSVASMTDGDVLTLQGATDDAGDFAEVMSDGNLGWYVTAKEGTWVRTTAT